MEILVRFAEREELARVNGLRRQVNEIHVNGRPDIFRPGFSEELQNHVFDVFDREDANVIVAVLENEIYGFASVEYLLRPQSAYNLERKMYRVEEFCVDGRFRRIGVATRLVEFMKKDALERGFSKIELDAWEFNQSALAFYEKIGFQAYRRYFELPLSPSQPPCGLKNAVLETPRLFLRPYEQGDFDALAAIISDAETMKYYDKPYDEKGVQRWLDWNFENYKTFGFGLWALVLKENGRMIGDCGITIQVIHGAFRPEIGYHVHKDFHRRGYASEAAAAVRDYVFTRTPFETVYSYMNAENAASYSTARKIGMKQTDEYTDASGHAMKVYSITREEWKGLRPVSRETPINPPQEVENT